MELKKHRESKVSLYSTDVGKWLGQLKQTVSSYNSKMKLNLQP